MAARRMVASGPSNTSTTLLQFGLQKVPLNSLHGTEFIAAAFSWLALHAGRG
jgi:hypothetical protein